MDVAIFFEEGGGSREIAGAVYGVADASDFFRGADFHGAFGHVHWSPELILIAVRIGEIDDRAFFALGGCLDRVRVRYFVPIEPSQVHVDVFGPDVKAATRQILAERFGRWVHLGLKERADAAGAALPPQEAGYFDISFPRLGCKTDERSSSKAGGIHRPVCPRDHVVRSDHKVIDPVNRAFGF